MAERESSGATKATASLDAAHDSHSETLVLKPLAQDEIRILVIHPGKDEDPIDCSLVHVGGYAPIAEVIESEPQMPISLEPLSLSSGEAQSQLEVDTVNPGWGSYEALSYMWGPVSPCHSISINGVIHSVRDNLFKALQILRLEKDPRRIWTDALCINQENIPERNMQVPIMNRIYRQTETVLVWLGEAEDDSDLAIDCFNSIVEDEAGDISHPKGVSFDGQPARDLNWKEMKAIWAISHRDYWARLWIIQEILCASKILILCGDKTTSADNILKGIYLVSDTIVRWQATGEVKLMEELRAMTLTAPGFEILRTYKGRRDSKQSFSIWDLLQLCRACRSECENINDRIYGLVGLLQDDEWQELKPDYTKTPAQLYIDVLLVRLAADERVQFFHLVSWDATLSRVNLLLNDPLWYNRIQFLPLKDVCLPSQLQKLEQTRGEINIAEAAVIMQTSSTIQVTSLWIPNFVHLEGKDVTWRDISLLQPLKTRYKEKSPAKLVHDPEPYLTLGAYKHRPTGRCRGFKAWNGRSTLAGLACSDIKPGDFLCDVPTINGLYLIIRSEKGGQTYTIIGRAFLMQNARNKFYKVLRFKINSKEHLEWDLPNFRSYACQMSVAEILFLTR